MEVATHINLEKIFEESERNTEKVAININYIYKRHIDWTIIIICSIFMAISIILFVISLKNRKKFWPSSALFLQLLAISFIILWLKPLQRLLPLLLPPTGQAI